MTKGEIEAVFAAVAYRGWKFHVGEDGPRLFLQVRFHGPCATTSEHGPQHGRKWLLSPQMTRSELVATAFKAVLTAEEHETREYFRYRGRAVFGPHIDVDILAALLVDSDALDMREKRAG